MKRVLIVLLFLPLLSWAQLKPTAPLQPDESKARLQQLGDSLRKYNGFENFDRIGWMVVWKTVQGGNYIYGVINDRGQTVLPCEYDCIRFQEHSDLIMVVKDNLAGFINRHLEWVIPQKYNGETWCSLECDDFFQYGMVVTTDKAGKQGVVDSTGREILPCKYDWVEIMEPDLFLIEEGNKGGAVNQRGDIVIPFVYESLHYLGDHYIEVKKQSLYSVISTKGHEILPFVYEHIYDYDNGRFAVKQDGKWGVVDSKGNIIVPFQNALRMYLEEGMDIIVKLLDDGSEELMDLKGNVLAKSYLSFSSTSGESIAVFEQKEILDDEEINIACTIYDRNWNKIGEFDEILYDCVDMINDITMIPVKRNGKWGFVNRDFQLIVPCVYTSVEGGCGYGTVTTADQQKMLINEQGEMLVKGPYKWMVPSINDWFKVCFVSPDESVAIQGFIDRFGNNTFTEEELKLMQKLHLQEMLEDDYGDMFLDQYAHEMPEFPGGIDSLYAYLNRNMQFPEEVKAKGLSGKVVAQFVVETDGSVNEVVIIEHFHPLCDEEVIRILQQMPAWKPGKNSDGKPIRCYFQIPIKFTAEKEEEGER